MANQLLKRARKGQAMISRDGRTIAPDYLTIADLYGPGGVSTIAVKDSLFTIVGDVDATKKITFQADTQATGSTLTIDVGAQSASRTLSIPVVTGNRTIALIDEAQTFSAAQTMSSTVTISAGTGQNLIVSSTTDSTSGTTGCAKFGGGIGYNGNLISAASSSRIAIGASGYLSRVGIYCSPAFTDSATAVYGMIFEATLTNSNTAFKGLNISGVGVASGKTLSSFYGVYVADTYGAGTTTDAYGIYVDPILVASGLKYAIYTNSGIVRIGDATDSSSTTTGGFQCIGGGAFAKSLTVGGTAGNFINIANSTGALKINSTQVVGAQITGYGTPTGASRLSSFPGATATLAQCSAQIAQIITDLKTHGLLGV